MFLAGRRGPVVPLLGKKTWDHRVPLHRDPLVDGEVASASTARPHSAPTGRLADLRFALPARPSLAVRSGEQTESYPPGRISGVVSDLLGVFLSQILRRGAPERLSQLLSPRSAFSGQKGKSTAETQGVFSMRAPPQLHSRHVVHRLHANPPRRDSARMPLHANVGAHSNPADMSRSKSLSSDCLLGHGFKQTILSGSNPHQGGTNFIQDGRVCLTGTCTIVLDNCDSDSAERRKKSGNSGGCRNSFFSAKAGFAAPEGRSHCLNRR